MFKSLFLKSCLAMALLSIWGLSPLFAGTYYIDPIHGSDSNPGTEALPFAKFESAVSQLLRTGGQLIMKDRAVFREPLILRGGAVDAAPIEVIGNGATIDLGIDVSDGPWIEDPRGYILDCPFPPVSSNALWGLASFFIDGRAVRIIDPRRQDTPSLGQFMLLKDGRALINFPEGSSPHTSNVTMTPGDRASCVTIGNLNNVTITNLIVKHSGNDGFNLYGNGSNVLLQDVEAYYCGDEGISAHGKFELVVNGAIVAFCGSQAGNIADVGESRTQYINTISVGSTNAGFYFEGAEHLLNRVVSLDNRIPYKDKKGTLEVLMLVDLDNEPSVSCAMDALVTKARQVAASR